MEIKNRKKHSMKVQLARTPNHPDMENKQNREYLEIHKNRTEGIIVVHNVVLLTVKDEQSLFHQTGQALEI